jgi:hypothetical protein
MEPIGCKEAIPKSAILMLFFSSKSKFSGLRSLWLLTPLEINRLRSVTYQMEWLWQKSRAEMICLKNLLASFGVNLPFFTK